jgi:hypothetical protein
MSIKIAIDPGLSGGIAYGTSLSDVNCIHMPDTTADLWNTISGLASEDGAVAVIENVGHYMPGNSGPSAVTFAQHIGELHMALTAAGIPYELVLPQKWMSLFATLKKYPAISKETPSAEKARLLRERKTERKNIIKQKAQQIFPYIPVTLYNADALGMYHYAMHHLVLFQEALPLGECK